MVALNAVFQEPPPFRGLVMKNLFPPLSSWDHVTGGQCVLVSFEGLPTAGLVLKENKEEVLVLLHGERLVPMIVPRGETTGQPFSLIGEKMILPPETNDIIRWRPGDPQTGLLALTRSDEAYISAQRASEVIAWVHLGSGAVVDELPDHHELVTDWRFVFRPRTGPDLTLFRRPA